MPPEGKYTDPKLREQVKEELKQSDKGGQPGQWSARKAQMMAAEYKQRGGDYTTDKDQKDESQQNLENWGKEEWQTKEGSGNAKKEDGTEKRYLPKKAWEKMSEKEKEETDQKKQQESKEGKQFVENTDQAKESRKKATKDGKDQQKEGQRRSARQQDKNNEKHKSAPKENGEAKKSSSNTKKSSSKTNNKKANESEEEFEDPGIDDDASPEHEDAKQDEDGAETEEDKVESEDDNKNKSESNTSQKRKATTDSKPSTKKQKSNTDNSNSKSKETVGSKHMDATEPGKQGSNDRLPKEGQQIHWKAMPGYVDGEVVEILRKGKKVDGKEVKASEKDVKLVLKSNKSGKICVHKPEACYYD